MNDPSFISTRWPRAERLVFRLAVPADESALLQGMEWDVARNLSGAKWPYTAEDARQFIAASNQDCLLGVCYEFVIVCKDTSAFVGVASLSLAAKNEVPGQIGYWIAQPMRRRGFAIESVRSLVEFAKRFSLAGLWACVRQDNTASINLLKQTGFEFARTQHGMYEGSDMLEDVYQLKL